jgi:hypothetical protein
VAGINRLDYRWGTNQYQGSSGGPLVMNFGENAVGQAFDLNRVVGVVSFGNPELGVAGSSKMGTSFIKLFRAACAAQPGNCRQAVTGCHDRAELAGSTRRPGVAARLLVLLGAREI